MSKTARNLVLAAGIGLIVTELIKLVLPMLADQFLRDSAQELFLAQNILDLAVMGMLAAGLLVMGLAWKSRLWLASAVLVGTRVLLGVLHLALRLSGVSGQGGGWAVLQVVFWVSILVTWVLVGIALIVRRHDGGAGLGMTAGILVFSSMGAFVYAVLFQVGVIPFDSGVFELADGTYLASNLFLAGFLLSLAARPQGPSGEIGRKGLFGLGGVGAVFLMYAMGLIWNQAVGIRTSGDLGIFVFAGLAGLGLVGLGLGYLGQGLILRKLSGSVAAVLTWLQVIIFGVAIAGGTSMALVWVLGLVTLTTQIAGGLSFLQASRLAAPRLAIGTGVAFLVSAAVSLLLLIFLEDRGFRLSLMVRMVMMALVTTGMLAAYTMAGVHYLLVAFGPARIRTV